MKRLALALVVALIAWPKVEHGEGFGDRDYRWVRLFIGPYVLEFHWSKER